MTRYDYICYAPALADYDTLAIDTEPDAIPMDAIMARDLLDTCSFEQDAQEME